MSFTITAEATVTVTYQVVLSDQAAKAIAKDFRDPDEKWADEAEHCLTTAFEELLGDLLEREISNSLPSEIETTIEGKTIALKHPEGWEPQIDIESVGVEA